MRINQSYDVHVDFLPRRGAVADVGSGAGFPGVVIALLRPDLEVTLIEPMERRIDWLTDIVAEPRTRAT